VVTLPFKARRQRLFQDRHARARVQANVCIGAGRPNEVRRQVAFVAATLHAKRHDLERSLPHGENKTKAKGTLRIYLFKVMQQDTRCRPKVIYEIVKINFAPGATAKTPACFVFAFPVY